MLGLRLNCRYACGEEDAEMYGHTDRLKGLLAEKIFDEAEAIRLLSELSSKDHLSLIANKNGIQDPFSMEVVTYYWRGRPELKGELWHNHQVLARVSNLALGQIHLEKINECLVHPALVLETFPKLIVWYRPVVIRQEKLVLREVPEQKEIERRGLNHFSPDSFISIHSSRAMERLEEQDAEILKAITIRSLNHFNSIRSKFNAPNR